MARVALIGAGFISRAHAEAVRLLPGAQLTAVIDAAPARAQELADAHAIPARFSSVEDALAADAFDRAHVLVPPDRHADVARLLINAGKPALVEKPLAHSAMASRELVDQALAAGVALGTNQNFVYHPAYAKLRRVIDEHGLGRPSHVSCTYNVPLRQIAARQFGHWMFADPCNLLLEQAVHPLSQIAVLAGEFADIRVLPGPALAVGSGQTIYPTMDVLLKGSRLSAMLRFAVGQTFPLWQLSVVCDDGVAVADMFANRFYTIGRTRWLDAVDNVASASRTAGEIVGASARNGGNYALSLLRLRRLGDPFAQSMRASIAGFHAALDAGRTPELDGRFGALLVEACERIGAGAFDAATVARTMVASAAIGPRRTPTMAILGGTGFIGTHLVKRCIADGIAVSVLARSTRGLDPLFDDPLVTLHAGNIRDPAAVDEAIGGAKVVVNLAHGGESGSREKVTAAMVDGAEVVARACLRAGVSRLIHVGSIASLYLGPQSSPVTGGTPPDPRFEERNDYARAKAICDRMLLDMHARTGLPVVILRPGLVVGDGGTPFHGGVGFFNNEQHCLGWNSGRNPLPFVLVEDVGDAILRACHVEGLEGRTYNIVGDIRPTARAYIAALGAAMQRPLKYHPQTPTLLVGGELGKWAIKRAGGRRSPLPSRRDFLSRGLTATFVCDDAKHDLGWTPVADASVFKARAIDVHAA